MPYVPEAPYFRMSPLLSARAQQYLAFDHLATMVAVVNPQGHGLFVNAAFESEMAISRRSLLGTCLLGLFVEVDVLREAVAAIARHEVSTTRMDGGLRRPGHSEALPVHVIITQIERCDDVLIELIEIEQQARLDREERALGQAQASKELVRNLAHEIKNPLGGIRGAAQLLEMEIESRALTEYTQVIIKEADRLQSLVDRLLAPHRKPHVVSDVNIHEVCERVRSLILAEFPRGLSVVRNYDISIPDFHGDREQLIQVVLNIGHNAAQALAERVQVGDARIIFRTRIARQVTLGKQRHRLALELHIEDNGPGVPESLRDRIFYPLVSGREGGSGLGLTLAQTFVQQHLGTIECDSMPGQTTFKIVLPLL